MRRNQKRKQRAKSQIMKKMLLKVLNFVLHNRQRKTGFLLKAKECSQSLTHINLLASYNNLQWKYYFYPHLYMRK